MIPIKFNEKDQVKLTVPFITKDNNNVYRMYYQDKDNIIRYLNMYDGKSSGEIYANIQDAVACFDTLVGEKLVEAEIIIKG